MDLVNPMFFFKKKHGKITGKEIYLNLKNILTFRLLVV